MSKVGWEGVGRVQLLTLFTSRYLNVKGRLGGSWPGTVVDIVHLGPSMSKVGWEGVGRVQLLTLFTSVPQCQRSAGRELAGCSLMHHFRFQKSDIRSNVLAGSARQMARSGNFGAL